MRKRSFTHQEVIECNLKKLVYFDGKLEVLFLPVNKILYLTEPHSCSHLQNSWLRLISLFLTALGNDSCFCPIGRKLRHQKVIGQTLEGICGRLRTGKGESDSQVVAFGECTVYLQTVCGFSCLGTAETALFQPLKIPVQTSALPDTNA